MSAIPVHRLQDKTDIGFELKAFNPGNSSYRKYDDSIAHRDDHYVFFLVTSGTASATVDFEEKTVCTNQLYYILPEQIHYRIQANEAEGWFIAADPSLMDSACRHAFESWSGFQEPVTLTRDDTQDFHQLLTILFGKMVNHSPGSVRLAVFHSLLRSFFELAADLIRISTYTDARSSRPVALSLKFKELLNGHIRQHKSPSAYAAVLHVSEAYLNESVKKTTGSPVSFWINYKIITEAKRLLYFSDLTVKQVAHELGFENHSYFCRFFGKQTGMTAGTFRTKVKVSPSVKRTLNCE